MYKILFILSFICSQFIIGNELREFNLVLRKDYENVKTEGSIILPYVNESSKDLDLTLFSIFEKSNRLIKSIDAGNVTAASEYAHDGSYDMVKSFCLRYKNIIGQATVRGLVKFGEIPVVYWSLEDVDDNRYLTRYFVFNRNEKGEYLWDPSFNDPFISLLASTYQNVLRGEAEPPVYDKVSQANSVLSGLGSGMLGGGYFTGDEGMVLPFFNWNYYLFVNNEPIVPLSKFSNDALQLFRRSQGLLNKSDFNQYSQLMTVSSKEKYTQWVSRLSEDQKSGYIEDVFRYKKDIRAVVQIDPFVLILYRLVLPDNLKPRTYIAYLVNEGGEFRITNVSFKGYFDRLVSAYDPFNVDTVELMIQKFHDE